MLAAGCGSQRVTLAVHAGSPLADSPVEVDVRGLDGPATLRARWTDLGGTVWTSAAPMHASVRLRGVAGMRFLWGMRPPRPAVPQDFRPPPTGPSPVALSVVQGGRTVARATVPRRVTPAAVGLRRLTVERDGVYGDLFTPRNRRPHPAVLLFGGSDGGNTMVDQAGLLAAHGYTTLSIAYFAAPGVPKHLLDIPLHEIEQRLRDRHFRFAHTALTYPRAGHLAGVALPYVPAPTVQDEFGGSARADAAAKADLWPRILRFLAALSPPRG